MKHLCSALGFALALGGVVSAQVSQVPLDGPALGERLTQAEVTSGKLTLQELRRRGLEIFSTPFNAHDGFGDGPVDAGDPLSPGGRPTANGTWLRLNGLDTQTCLECHSVLSNRTIPSTFAVGGAGGIGASAFPGLSDFDVADLDASGAAEVNGRMINPPFLFGAGGVELVGKEMTMDLQALKAQAQASPGTQVALVTKGVDFGTISFDGGTETFDTSGVVGIDEDLVVRPFGRKGGFSSIRAFDLGALEFHHGMQPVEVVGDGVDADGDGVVNEMLEGELSALHIFGVSLERPVQKGKRGLRVQAGRREFLQAGCASCHRPQLETESKTLELASPEVEVDPTQNVFLSIDLQLGSAGFAPSRSGGLTVDLFSDLKRHEMGSFLGETTGDPLDDWFITPRLWGVADTAPYLHDGRALTLRQAIEMHGGEGTQAASNFQALSEKQQTDLLFFLGTLRVPRKPNEDIL